MKFNDLPRVIITVIDRSEFFTGVLGTRPALIIGQADKGPIGIPIEINNTNQLIFTFGKPISSALLTAYLYLTLTGNPVVFIRAFHPDFITGIEVSE